MIRLLRFIFTGDWHIHKWTTFDQVEVVDIDSDPVATKFYMRCDHCGQLRTFRS